MRNIILVSEYFGERFEPGGLYALFEQGCFT